QTMALEPMAKSTNRALPRLMRRSLNDRNRMFDTINRLKQSVRPNSASVYCSPPSAPPTALLAKAREIKIPEAGGVGRPMMYLLGLTGTPWAPLLSTLNLASRIAAHATNRNDVIRPATGCRCSTQL